MLDEGRSDFYLRRQQPRRARGQLLAFQLGFSQTEANTVHGSFLLFLVPPADDLWSGTVELSRSGAVDRLSRTSNTITFEGVTYLPDDPLCCPSGYQRITLTWTGDALVATARCLGKGRQAPPSC